MKVKATTAGKPKTRIVLTLSKREAKLLVGLADFPSHYAQPDNVREFLSKLSEDLTEATDCWDSPAAMGYTNKTSL